MKERVPEGTQLRIVQIIDPDDKITIGVVPLSQSVEDELDPNAVIDSLPCTADIKVQLSAVKKLAEKHKIPITGNRLQMQVFYSSGQMKEDIVERPHKETVSKKLIPETESLTVEQKRALVPSQAYICTIFIKEEGKNYFAVVQSGNPKVIYEMRPLPIEDGAFDKMLGQMKGEYPQLKFLQYGYFSIEDYYALGLRLNCTTYRGSTGDRSIASSPADLQLAEQEATCIEEMRGQFANILATSKRQETIDQKGIALQQLLNDEKLTMPEKAKALLETIPDIKKLFAECDQIPILAELNLQDFVFEGGDVSECVFSGCNLQNTIFKGTKLKHTGFMSSGEVRTNLLGARFLPLTGPDGIEQKCNVTGLWFKEVICDEKSLFADLNRNVSGGQFMQSGKVEERAPTSFETFKDEKGRTCLGLSEDGSQSRLHSVLLPSLNDFDVKLAELETLSGMTVTAVRKVYMRIEAGRLEGERGTASQPKGLLDILALPDQSALKSLPGMDETAVKIFQHSQRLVQDDRLRKALWSEIKEVLASDSLMPQKTLETNDYIRVWAKAIGPLPDFRNLKLAGMDVSGNDFTNQMFDGADLTNANFRNCTLTNASFKGAITTGTDFTGAIDLDLTGKTQGETLRQQLECVLKSNVSYAEKIREVNDFIVVWRVRVDAYPDFSNLTLPGINFSGADLSGFRFDGANLKGTKFQNTTLTGASFKGADVTGAYFDGAKGLVLSEEQRKVIAKEAKAPPPQKITPQQAQKVEQQNALLERKAALQKKVAKAPQNAMMKSQVNSRNLQLRHEALDKLERTLGLVPDEKATDKKGQSKAAKTSSSKQATKKSNKELAKLRAEEEANRIRNQDRKKKAAEEKLAREEAELKKQQEEAKRQEQQKAKEAEEKAEASRKKAEEKVQRQEESRRREEEAKRQKEARRKENEEKQKKEQEEVKQRRAEKAEEARKEKAAREEAERVAKKEIEAKAQAEKAKAEEAKRLADVKAANLAKEKQAQEAKAAKKQANIEKQQQEQEAAKVRKAQKAEQKAKEVAEKAATKSKAQKTARVTYSKVEELTKEAKADQPERPVVAVEPNVVESQPVVEVAIGNNAAQPTDTHGEAVASLVPNAEVVERSGASPVREEQVQEPVVAPVPTLAAPFNPVLEQWPVANNIYPASVMPLPLVQDQTGQVYQMVPVDLARLAMLQQSVFAPMMPGYFPPQYGQVAPPYPVMPQVQVEYTPDGGYYTGEVWVPPPHAPHVSQQPFYPPQSGSQGEHSEAQEKSVTNFAEAVTRTGSKSPVSPRGAYVSAAAAEKQQNGASLNK